VKVAPRDQAVDSSPRITGTKGSTERDTEGEALGGRLADFPIVIYIGRYGIESFQGEGGGKGSVKGERRETSKTPISS